MRLNFIYGAALANICLLAIGGMLFEVPNILKLFLPASSTGMDSHFVLDFDVFLFISLLIVAAPLIFLVRRPKWWGKLLLIAYGLSWIGYDLARSAIMWISGRGAAGLWIPAICGVVMIALAITHQIIDPAPFRRRPKLADQPLQ